MKINVDDAVKEFECFLKTRMESPIDTTNEVIRSNFNTGLLIIELVLKELIISDKILNHG